MGTNTATSSRAKAFPTVLVLLLNNSIVTQVAVGINVYTTFCQLAGGTGASAAPETKFDVDTLVNFTPISAVVAVLVTSVEIDFIQ